MTAGGHRSPLQQVSFWISSPVGAKESLKSFAPPVLTPLTAYNPGLAPGATLSRRSAAVIRMRFARLQVHSANFFVYASVYGSYRWTNSLNVSMKYRYGTIFPIAGFLARDAHALV